MVSAAPGLTARDIQRLARVDLRLVRVAQRALLDNPGLFFIDAYCARDIVAELQMMAKGVSRVKDPYDSKHVVGPRRPLSLAIDCIPRGWLNVDDIPLEAWQRVADAIKKAAADEGVAIQWGADLWHGWDKPHYQLAPEALQPKI